MILDRPAEDDPRLAETFGGQLAKLRQEAADLGAGHLVDQADALREDAARRRDAALSDRPAEATGEARLCGYCGESSCMCIQPPCSCGHRATEHPELANDNPCSRCDCPDYCDPAVCNCDDLVPAVVVPQRADEGDVERLAVQAALETVDETDPNEYARSAWSIAEAVEEGARAAVRAVLAAQRPAVADDTEVEALRTEIIEAMSWAESLDVGRWGQEKASALLSMYEDILAVQRPSAPVAVDEATVARVWSAAQEEAVAQQVHRLAWDQADQTQRQAWMWDVAMTIEAAEVVRALAARGDER